jgi:hypothetical protein
MCEGGIPEYPDRGGGTHFYYRFRFIVCVCVNLKQDHTVQRRSCGRVPGGARLHDYWQQASKRGATKEVGFPGCRPDGDGERRAAFRSRRRRERSDVSHWR